MPFPCSPSSIFIEICWQKGMLAYAKPQQRKKADSEKRTGEGDKIEFINFRFEREQVIGYLEYGWVFEFAKNGNGNLNLE